jgi:hypothetical protein
VSDFQLLRGQPHAWPESAMREYLPDQRPVRVIVNDR